MIVSGQVGLGVSSTISSAGTRLAVGGDISFAYDNTTLMFNSYFASNWTYYSNGYAYYIKGDTSTGLVMQSANTGTAGNAISWVGTLCLTPTGNFGVNDFSPGTQLSVVGNAQIGFSSATTASPNGLAVSGPVGIGVSGSFSDRMLSVAGSSSAATPYAATVSTSVTCTGTNSGSACLYLGGTHTINGSSTNNAEWLQIFPTVVATSNIGDILGIYSSSVSTSGSGTINRAFGGYFNDPGVTVLTSKMALYADNMSIGYPNNTPPGGGLLVAGNVGIGTSSPSSELTINGTTAIWSGDDLLFYTDLGSTQKGEVGTSGGGDMGIWSLTNGNWLRLGCNNANIAFFVNNGIRASTPAQFSMSSNGGFVIDASATNITPPSNGLVVSGQELLGTSSAATTSALEILSLGNYSNNESSTNGICIRTGNTSTDWALYMGADKTNGCSYIQSVQWGLATSSLVLNARGGIVGIGTGAPIASSQLTVTPSSSSIFSGIDISGSFTGAAQIGINSQAVYTNATSFAQSILSAPIFVAASSTSIGNASCFYASPFYTGNAGTIDTSYGFYYDGGGAAVGTITTAYGGCFLNPAAGSYKTALYSDNMSIGYGGSSLSSIPSNGMIVYGSVGIGTNNPGTNGLVISGTWAGNGLQANASTTTARDTYNFGGENSNNTSDCDGTIFQTQLSPTTGGSGFCRSVWIYPIIQPTGGFTVTSSYALLVDGGTYTGTITNSYGGYFTNPPGGTNKTALYADNISIGYTGSSLSSIPTNGLIVAGQVGIGLSSVSSGTQVHISTVISGSVNTTGLQIDSNHATSAGTGNSATQIFSYLTYNSANNLDSSYSIFIASGANVGAGVVTNSYGLYATNPSFGTNKTALYSDNMSIGYTATTPPPNGLVVSGQELLGTSSAATTSALEILSIGNYANNETGTNGICIRTGNTTDFDWALYMGADNYNGCCYIESVQWGSSIGNTFSNLYINSRGGAVGIGVNSITINMGAQLTINPLGTSIFVGLDISGDFSDVYGEPSGILSHGIYSLMGMRLAADILSAPSFAAESGYEASHVACFQASPSYIRNLGTIDTIYGFYYPGGETSSGTITTAYGGYLATPTVGANKIALYTDNIAIGTTATAPPSSGILVAGNIKATGLGTGTGTTLVLTSGNLIVANTSSKKFKDNIKPIQKEIDLSKLNTVQFNYKEEKAICYGMIAEELYELYPEFVNLDEEGEPFSINYQMFIPILIKEIVALKKLQKIK